MKTIPGYTDLTQPPEAVCEESCVSHLHSYIQKADTATTRAEVRYSQNSLLRIQGQCCKLIHTLAVDENINRADPGNSGPEMLEHGYNDLIEFISGVGSACGNVIKRLDGFYQIEVRELIERKAS